MSKYKTKTEEIESIYVDKETGELIEKTIKKTFTIKDSSEPFFQVYLNYISWIYGIKSVAPFKLLCKFMELAAFNKNKIDLFSKNLDKKLYDELGLSKSTFTKALTTLSELGVISGERGSYIVNEQLLWKGDKREREALLNAKLKATFEIAPNEDFKTE